MKIPSLNDLEMEFETEINPSLKMGSLIFSDGFFPSVSNQRRNYSIAKFKLSVVIM